MRKIFISIAIFSGALAFAAPQQPVTAVSGASATAAKVVKYPAPAPAPAPATKQHRVNEPKQAPK